MKYSNLFYTISVVAILNGCMTLELTPEGSRVRTISSVVAQNCELKSTGSIFKPILAGGLSAAQIEARNDVASFGGNAMVIISQYMDPPPYQHGHISLEGYYCKNLETIENTATRAKDNTLGLIFDDLSDQQKMMHERNSGIVITKISEDSPAWDANIIPSDVIIGLNEQPVRNAKHAHEILSTEITKNKIIFKLIRKGQIRQIELTRK
jgi:hypothetical protein